MKVKGKPPRPRVRDLDDASVWREVIANIDLARDRARWHHRRHRREIDLDDLEQAGILGLFRAVELFDPAMGCKFTGYAVDWINEEIQQAIVRQSGPGHVPRLIARRAAAAAVDGSLERTECIEAALRFRRIVAGGHDAGDHDVFDAVAARTEPEPWPVTLPPAVVLELMRLTAREKRTVAAWAGFGREPVVNRVIAAELGVTHQRVAKMRRDVIRRLQVRLLDAASPPRAEPIGRRIIR